MCMFVFMSVCDQRQFPSLWCKERAQDLEVSFQSRVQILTRSLASYRPQATGKSSNLWTSAFTLLICFVYSQQWNVTSSGNPPLNTPMRQDWIYLQCSPITHCTVSTSHLQSDIGLLLINLMPIFPHLIISSLGSETAFFLSTVLTTVLWISKFPKFVHPSTTAIPNIISSTLDSPKIFLQNTHSFLAFSLPFSLHFF